MRSLNAVLGVYWKAAHTSRPTPLYRFKASGGALGPLSAAMAPQDRATPVLTLGKRTRPESLSPVAGRVPRALGPAHARRGRVARIVVFRARGSCESRVLDPSAGPERRRARRPGQIFTNRFSIFDFRRSGISVG